MKSTTERRIFCTSIRQTPALLLVSVFLTFGMWFFVDRVWAPQTEMHFSDLYPRWYGSRELLLHGRDPYSAAVTREIQVWAHGHPLESDPENTAKDGDRFAYPLYIAFVLAPTVGLQFSQVARSFRFLFPVLVCASVPLWLYMLQWRCNRWILISLILLTLGSFPVLECLYLQQPLLLAITFMAAAGSCLTSGRLGLAGALLALATIKPQLTVLVVPWLLLWACSDWPSRKKLVWSFGSTLLLLVGFSQYLVPGWINEFISGLGAYQRYTGNMSILTVYLSNIGSAIVSAGLIAAWAVLAWRRRKLPAGSRAFNFTVCATLVTTVVLLPTLYPTGQVALLPAFFFLLKEFRMVWDNGRASRLACVAAFSLTGWPWLGAWLFVLASSVIPIERLKQFWLIPLSTLLLVPLSLLVLLSINLPAMIRSRAP
jgi:Glycosyltransferase family 87